MKKIIIASILSLSLSFTYAEFQAYVPLEVAKGGSLPNGSINLGGTGSSQENWLPYTPFYTNWTPSGAMTGCTWVPLENTINQGVSFQQFGYGCRVDESRSRQEREIEQNTNTIRNIGSPVIEEQNTALVMQERSAIGTKNPADCQYDANLTSSESTTTVTTAHTIYVPESGPPVMTLYWGGSVVYTGTPVITWDLGGYRYSQGDFRTSHSYTWLDITDYSELCRQPL